MRCPVCGSDHIQAASDLISQKSILFSPCPDCIRFDRDKRSPPDDTAPHLCSCGKAYLDDVFVRLYHILVDEGLFSGIEPLLAVGSPLIDPGFSLRSPPFLPPRSLLLISSAFDPHAADKAYQQIPQLSGILLRSDHAPGVGDIRGSENLSIHEHELLCGCDVRADLFSTSHGPVLIYKKQGSIHIEFSRGMDPKIRSLENVVRQVHPVQFVDACAGPGTLGLSSMRLGVPYVIMNDPWYAAAFFSGFNIQVNKDILGLQECNMQADLTRLADVPVKEEPFMVAEGYGPEKGIEVFQGMMEYLSPLISHSPVLTAFDPFEKREFSLDGSFLSSWKEKVGGEVFIP